MQITIKKAAIISAMVALPMLFAARGWTGPDEKKSIISWMGYEDGMRAATERKLPAMIYFWAERCPPCDRLEADSFNNPEIAAYIKLHMVPIKLNFFDNLAISKKFKNNVTPAVFFLEPGNDKLIHSAHGYYSPEEFQPILEYVGEGHYKTMSFKKFEKKRHRM